MNRFGVWVLCVAITGCGADQPPLAGGRAASFWVQELQNTDAKSRRKAVVKLGNLGAADPATVPALIGALRDADAAVRAEAALALLRIGAPAEEAVSALKEAQSDRNPTVRTYAGKALQKIQSGP
jgi:HEAT repeat protein